MSSQENGTGEEGPRGGSDMFAPPLFTFSGFDDNAEGELDPIDDFFMQEFFAQASEATSSAYDSNTLPSLDVLAPDMSRAASASPLPLGLQASEAAASTTSTTMPSPSLNAQAPAIRISEEPPVLDQQALAAEIEEKVNEAMRQSGSKRKNTDEEGGDAQRQRVDGMDRLERSRARNRVHARKSRLRKKFFVDSLKKNLEKLEDENKALREFIVKKLGKDALPSSLTTSGDVADTDDADSIFFDAKEKAEPSKGRTVKTIEAPDYKLMHALHQSQQNFVVTDPYLPDNPVVFASSGFYKLTGFQPNETIGRNCRFLQGPATDQEAVKMIRDGVRNGKDTTVCLVNYTKDGTPFWNQFFVAPLRGVDGQIVNYVGVQCEVDDSVALGFLERISMRASAEKQLQAARDAAGGDTKNWRDLSQVTSPGGTKLRGPEVPLAPFFVGSNGEGYRVSNGQFFPLKNGSATAPISAAPQLPVATPGSLPVMATHAMPVMSSAFPPAAMPNGFPPSTMPVSAVPTLQPQR